MDAENQSVKGIWCAEAGYDDRYGCHHKCGSGKNDISLYTFPSGSAVYSHDDRSDETYASEHDVQHRDECDGDNVPKSVLADLDEAEGRSKGGDKSHCCSNEVFLTSEEQEHGGSRKKTQGIACITAFYHILPRQELNQSEKYGQNQGSERCVIEELHKKT